MANANTKPDVQEPSVEVLEVVEDSTVQRRLKRKKAVTLPVVKLERDIERYLKMLEPIHQGEQIKSEKTKGMEPAQVAHVVDVITGEEGILICAALIEGNLTKAYPEHSYVGKTFEITKRAGRGDQRYNLYDIFEVEDDV